MVALQSVTHKVLPQSLTSVFPHTTLPSNRSSFSATSALQRNNNRSGANHVRTIFTVYVGLLCVVIGGYMALLVRTAFVS